MHLQLKIEKTKVFKKKDKPWVAKLENEKPDQAILVGYYYTWQEALDKGLVAYSFANAQLNRKLISTKVDR